MLNLVTPAAAAAGLEKLKDAGRFKSLISDLGWVASWVNLILLKK